VPTVSDYRFSMDNLPEDDLGTAKQLVVADEVHIQK
jgi:hypothetical protein